MPKMEIDALLEEDKKRLLDAACLLGSFAAQAAVFGTIRLLSGQRAQVPQLQSWMSVGQVARLLGKSRQTIRNWIHEGSLPAEQRADGKYLVSRDEIQKLIER